MGICRHRLLCDGNGVRTLVAFYGCPLSCKYCLNQDCHNLPVDSDYYSSCNLLNKVNVDSIYFIATGGGITFGGGEPLLYADFIEDFIGRAPAEWNFFCETSLNVQERNLKTVLNIVDKFIVDIKDISSDIYEPYTNMDNTLVLSNLEKVAQEKLCDKFLIRIPNIPKYNSYQDVEKSIKFLQAMGYSRFEKFTYVTDISNVRAIEEDTLYNGCNSGKVTCEVLRQIRKAIAAYYNIPFVPNICSEKICAVGTCPTCEQELRDLTNMVNNSPFNKLYMEQ